jgi:hypothetical protein
MLLISPRDKDQSSMKTFRRFKTFQRLLACFRG